MSVLGVLGGAVLAWALAAPRSAIAQDVRPVEARARGEYTCVAGRINAGGKPAVYIIDAANQELIALKWDQNKQNFVGIGYRSILTDSRAARGR